MDNKPPDYRPIAETLDALNHLVKAMELMDVLKELQGRTWDAVVTAAHDKRHYELSLLAVALLGVLGDSPEFDQMVADAKKLLKSYGLTMVEVQDAKVVVN